jgi:hypothetical protein
MPRKPFAYPKIHSKPHSLGNNYCYKVAYDEQHVLNVTQAVPHLATQPPVVEACSLLCEPKHEIAG